MMYGKPPVNHQKDPYKNLAPFSGKASRKFCHFLQPFRKSPAITVNRRRWNTNSTVFEKIEKKYKFFD